MNQNIQNDNTMAKAKEKFRYVMHEWKAKKLHS
ncbi:unnamed protein product, partial [marine sediment metagenome]